MERGAWIVGWLALAGAAAAATYEVGPGRRCAALGDVPWTSLGVGDTVLIHWREDPYKEKVLIAAGGRERAPVTLRGVKGPRGQLPVIDGDGARTPAAFREWSGERGVVQIGGADSDPAGVPAYVVIENLEIRGGRPPNTFAAADGAVRRYPNNAASLYVRRGRHITIRGCTLHASGNGLMIGSSDRSVSSDILVESNYIHGNGNPGSIYHHNSYTAAAGITFQYNRYGPLAPGAGGNNLKDRSVALVVRYNWIEGGNRQLDLVDAEDSVLLRADPRYRATHVYGNILIERERDGNNQVVHYGGDSRHLDWYRQGTLFFYHNTVVSARRDRTVLFRLSTAGDRADARNNVFYTVAGGETLGARAGDGELNLGRNWFKTGTAVPGFTDEGSQSFAPARGSPLIEAGEPLPPPFHAVDRQYRQHQAGEPRARRSRLDLGAFGRR